VKVQATGIFCPLPKDLVYRSPAIVLSHILEVGARSAFAVREVLISYEYQQFIVRNEYLALVPAPVLTPNIRFCLGEVYQENWRS